MNLTYRKEFEYLEEIEILQKRLRHLLTSDFISSFDEMDGHGNYKRDIKEADAIASVASINGVESVRVVSFKKCPFCGGRAEINTFDGLYAVACRGCGMATGLYSDPKMAVDVWERRAKTSPEKITITDFEMDNEKITFNGSDGGKLKIYGDRWVYEKDGNIIKGF